MRIRAARPRSGLAAPEGSQQPPRPGQERPGNGGQTGLTRRVSPGLGNWRDTRVSARHHGECRRAVCIHRQQHPQRAGLTARCPSCHPLVRRACRPPVAIHWPPAPPTCTAYAWRKASRARERSWAVLGVVSVVVTPSSIKGGTARKRKREDGEREEGGKKVERS